MEEIVFRWNIAPDVRGVEKDLGIDANMCEIGLHQVRES